MYLIISTEYCLIFKICTLSLVDSYDRWTRRDTQWSRQSTDHCASRCKVKCSAKRLSLEGERGGGGEKRGVTRIQFITSEVASHKDANSAQSAKHKLIETSWLDTG